jgi:hypothetical protein
LKVLASTFGLGLSMHSNSHLGISRMAMAQAAAATPPLSYACDTHYPWQSEEDEVLIGGRVPIEGGRVRIPDRPGLGVELDPDRLARARGRYARIPFRRRDDEADVSPVALQRKTSPKVYVQLSGSAGREGDLLHAEISAKSLNQALPNVKGKKVDFKEGAVDPKAKPEQAKERVPIEVVEPDEPKNRRFVEFELAGPLPDKVGVYTYTLDWEAKGFKSRAYKVCCEGKGSCHRACGCRSFFGVGSSNFLRPTRTAVIRSRPSSKR